MSKSDSNSHTEKNNDFGFILTEARKSKNYSVDDICEHLKIPKNVISAIEANNIEALPAPTFTQGYIRAYAKFLEIAEDNLLAMYNEAVPHELASALKPRSSLPGEASSQSPLVKMVTMLLIAGGVAAVLYGSIQYYQEKADVMEGQLESKERSFTGNSLDSPGSNRLDIQQDMGITEEDEIALESSDQLASQDSESQLESAQLTADSSEEVVSEQDQAIPQDDVINILAEQGAWMEVRDATRARLLYNMVPSGGSKLLQGKGPFRISMGNARSTRVFINDVEIDFTKYISSKNTASFTVSIEGESIIFH
jgi:cytoskeleton protein RodZ